MGFSRLGHIGRILFEELQCLAASYRLPAGRGYANVISKKDEFSTKSIKSIVDLAIS
jgi:hypothetical protein